MSDKHQNIASINEKNSNTFLSTLLWVLESYLQGRYHTRLISELKEIKNTSFDNESLSKVNSNINNKSEPIITTRPLSSASENDLASLGKSNTVTNPAKVPFNRKPTPHDLQAFAQKSFPGYELPRNDFVEYDLSNVSVSPAWGFYVAITPEQQELFTKTKTATPLSNKTSYRKSPLC